MADTPKKPPSRAHEVFAKRLQHVMSRAGLNQSDLARRAQEVAPPDVKITRIDVHRYVHGTHLPEEPKLLAIARALRTTPNTLFPPNMRHEAGRDRAPAPAVSVEHVRGQQTRLFVNLEVPLTIAMQVLALVEPYAPTTSGDADLDGLTEEPCEAPPTEAPKSTRRRR